MSNCIQWNSVITNSVVNEHSVITNRFLVQIGYNSTQMNPVITNKNDRSRAVRYNRVSLYSKILINSFQPAMFVNKLGKNLNSHSQLPISIILLLTSNTNFLWQLIFSIARRRNLTFSKDKGQKVEKSNFHTKNSDVLHSPRV
jgi:hypothetical protein